MSRYTKRKPYPNRQVVQSLFPEAEMKPKRSEWAVKSWSFPKAINYALAAEFTYGNGSDPNSVQTAVRSVAWVDDSTGLAGGIDNGQSTGVPVAGCLTVTIKCGVLTTVPEEGDG